MRRIMTLMLLIVLVATVAVTGYLGYRNAQSTAITPPPKPVTVAVSCGQVLQTVTAPGQLVGIQETMLATEVSGRVLQLSARPGSIVQVGDVIARLDAAPYEMALETARIRLAQAEAGYEHQLAEAALAIEAGEAQVDSAIAQTPSLTVAEVNLQNARDAEARAAYEYQKAQDRHWEPPEVVEAYRLEWVNTQRAVEIAEAEYNRIRNEQWSVSQEANSLSKDVAQTRLNAQYLAESGVSPLLQLAVEEAETNLAKTVITAPFDGVVLDVFSRPGEQLSAGANVALITDPGQGEVRTTVIEEDLSWVTAGQAAEIYFDARPDVVVNGQVARIVPQRVPDEARPLYHVYLSLNDALPDGVYPGMTADAALLIESVNDVLRLPRALVTTRSDGTATVEVWENGSAVAREVTTGLRGDVYIAVLEGLAEGDEVVGE
jgi:RND family efflux transporter MFP subunit